MKPFAYVTALTAESAIEFAGDGGRFFAGGIDLLGELKEEIAATKTLVNVKTLPGTGEIQAARTAWTLGANVTLAQLTAHPELHRVFPGLAEAAADVGSPQIRSIATVGGNLAQHSRCWYYRHRDVECRKKGGKACFARTGENKLHSIFTGCMCLSPLVSNLAVALAALDARVIVLRGSKSESHTLAELYATAWSTPTAHNSLRPADLILRVEIPVVAGARSTYLQISEKSDFDWALVSCAAAAKVSGRTLSGVRIALGAVAPIPWQVDAAGRFLEGKSLDDEVATQAAGLMLRDATPFSGNGYKIPIAQALVRRALKKLVA